MVPFANAQWFADMVKPWRIGSMPDLAGAGDGSLRRSGVPGMKEIDAAGKPDTGEDLPCA